MLTRSERRASSADDADVVLRQPGRLSVRQALVAWFVAAFAMALVGTLVHVASLHLAGRKPADLARLSDTKYSPLLHDPTWISLATLINELTVAAVLITWLWRVKPPLGVALPFRIPSVAAVFGALLLVFGLGPIAEAAGALVQRALRPDLTIANIVLSAAGGRSALEFGAVLLCLALLPALVEESMFRGAVTAAFARRSRLVQIVVPSILFGLFHFEPTQVAGTIVLGLGFGAARVLSGSLWPGVIAHGLFNGLVLIGARFDNHPPDWTIRGGELAIGAVMTLLGLGILLWARLRSGAAVSPEPKRP